MRVGHRQGWLKRVKQGAGACALGMMFALAGASAGPPEPPATSDIALRILPYQTDSARLDAEAMSDHPVFRMIRRAGVEFFGLEPLRFLDDTFEGTLLAAVLSKSSKGGTSLADFFRDQDLRERWKNNANELRSLAEDLKYEFAENEKPYPQELQPYLDEVRYYEPYLSGGAGYRYERLNDGRDFRLTMTFTPDSGLKKLGPAPVYSSSEGYKNETPTARPLPMNLVVAAKIRQKEQLVSVLTQAMGEPRDGFWRAEGEMPFFVTIRNEWVVGADQMENLGGLLRSLNGQAPGWSSTPGFKKVARNINVDAPLLLYVNTPSLLKAAAGDDLGEVEQKLASLVGPMGYAGVPYAESQFRLEMFVGIEAPKGSELQKYLESSGGLSPDADVSTSNIPWDVSNMFAVNYPNARALIDAVVALFPEAEAQLDMGEDVMLGMFGLDAEAGLEGLIEGNAMLCFERIDIFAAGFESAMDIARPAVQQDEASYEEVPTDGGPAEEASPEPETKQEQVPELEAEPEPEPRTNPLAYMPATIAVQVPLESNRKAVANILQSFMGDPDTRNVHGVDVVHSEDGTFAYAFDQNWLYLSGGRTSRLMKHMLEAAHGRKESLASIDSWSRFTVGGKGRLLMFSHQKVDPVYSLVKGFLLFLGSDFRPLATELGKLRDYHALGTVVPDGILLVGEVVKGDGR